MELQSIQGKISYFSSKMPDKAAIEFGNESITYKELEDESNRIARFFQDKTAAVNNIPILLDKGINLVLSILGILKSGGVFIPIDPLLPQNRIKLMLDQVNMEWVITQSIWLDMLDDIMEGYDGKIRVLIVDTIQNRETHNALKHLEIYELEDIAEKEPFVKDEILNKNCYIYFTSGSTGKPKAILGRHRSLKHFVDWEIKTFGVDESFRISQITSQSFDPFLRDTFVPLCSGATLCIPESREVTLIPERLKEWIEKSKINLIHIVPTLFRSLAQVTMEPEAFKELRYILLAGEMLRGNDIKKFFDLYGSRIQMINLYGPTETTLAKLFYRITERDVDKARIPVGKPIEGAQIMVLNEDMQEADIGDMGEIYIRTPFISSGYYNDKDLSRKVFIRNPFSDNPKDIIYKTGDIGRIMPDGNVELLGRADYQAKIRGVRVELGEIENQLLNYRTVREAVVVAREDKENYSYVCAYIVADEKLLTSDLRAFLLKELPEYMIPSYFVQLDTLPLTPNGKVDRKILPEPDKSIDTGREYIAPEGEVEEKLAVLWQEILGLERVGTSDNFFEIGGHSLKATTLISRIHREFSVDVPLREVFKSTTIKGLALYITNSQKSVYEAIDPSDKKDYYPLSSAQKRLYAIYQMDASNIGYNIPRAAIIEGKLDKGRLEEAFKTLTARHGAFRTSFEMLEGRPVQKIHDDVNLKIMYFETEDKQPDKVMQEFVKPFDLDKPPLCRVGLLSLSEEKHIMMFDMHHIISDGTSMAIVASEFIRLYNGENLPELRIQYRDYAEWQNKGLNTDAMKNQEIYWLKQFAGEIPVLNMPTDYPRPNKQSFEGGSMHFRLESEYLGKLKNMAFETGTTLYMVLLAAYNVILSKYTGQEDIIVGSPIAGRPHADLSDIVGVFINTLAMRNFPERNKTFKEFLLEVKENALKAYENQDYQFDKLVEKLNIRRDISRNPLFDTMFMLHNMDMQEIAATGLEFKQYTVKNETSKFDIALAAAEEQEEITFIMEYSTKLFNEDSIKQLAVHFTNVLKQVAENPEDKLSDIDILADEEKRTILSGFNNTLTQYPKDKTIHALFEEQAERTPDRTALVFKDESLLNKTLTYKELNDRSNHLARILRGKGVKPDSIVGIMMERSLEMIVAIMGILKAGGAYLPIDPGYPKDRINYMLSDSKAPVLITQEKDKEHFEFKGDIILTEELTQPEEGSTNLTETSTPENLAYVIYTSGSTGKPKGVMLEHRAVNNFIKGITDLIAFTPDNTILALTSISFDIFVLETLLPLTKGMKIVIADEKEQGDASLLSEVINAHQVDMLQATPSRIQMLANDKKSVECLKGVSTLMIGGEALPETLLKEIKQICRGRIYNMYGPTETTVWSTVKELTEEDRISIGKPIANTSAYIVDQSMMPTPVGVPGELYIGGDGLARGYLNNPELTKEKFIENPFESEGRIYRTGDLARWLPDGNIEFLGRVDQQVKIRGYRIELGEIESAINEQEGVVEAVVYVRESSSRNQYLCAYLVLEKTDVQSIKNNLKKKLPDYMLPTAYIVTDKIPLTPNGKVDRKALLNIQQPEDIQNKIPPRNFHDNTIADIWKEVLGLEEVYIHDDFFEIGGNSINIIQVAYKIKAVLGVEVTAADLMAYKTVHELSDYITSGGSDRNSQYKCVFKINKSTSPKNIFIVHGGDVNIYYYRYLAKLLEDEYSVYGIQPRGLNGEEPFPDSTYHMLYDYIREIRLIQEKGPYIIGGYCIGGYLCNDIVNILEMQGDKVAAMLQLDQEAFIEKKHIRMLRILNTILRIIDIWRRITRKDKMYTLEKLMKLIPDDKPTVSKERQQEILKDKKSLSHYFQTELPFNTHYFYLGFPHSPTLVIKAEDNTHRLFKKELWEKMAKGPLEYYEVPGNHETVLLPPYVDKVAEIVRGFLCNK
jgi:amino acid adenylation domain-containing protein